jgi:hypothetical protein
VLRRDTLNLLNVTIANVENMTTNNVDEVTDRLEKLDFHHPFTPYDVQEQFMKTVFDVLETGDGQVGILESPTGTVSSRLLPLKCWIWLLFYCLIIVFSYANSGIRVNLYRSFVPL